jgi:hypothetical protein
MEELQAIYFCIRFWIYSFWRTFVFATSLYEIYSEDDQLATYSVIQNFSQHMLKLGGDAKLQT